MKDELRNEVEIQENLYYQDVDEIIEECPDDSDTESAIEFGY